MKSIFFTLIMIASTALWAQSNESILSTMTSLQAKRGNDSHSEKKCRPGAAGILTLAYGSIFTQEDEEILSGNPLTFTNETQASTNVSLVSPDPNIGISGSLLISEPGDYFVIYGLTLGTSGDLFSRFALTLNGIIVPGSSINITVLSQVTTISTIIHVTQRDSILRFISLSNVITGPVLAGSVTAFISVEKLHNLQTP